jgi:hypothetical protein
VAEKRRILIQLDSDTHPSVFDRVVAVDAGAEELFSYGGVAATQVRDLVYGAIFTRGPADLKHTAIFVGGRDVRAGEELVAQVRAAFFGPMRVSVMLDSNGANTTAAAAVLAAAKEMTLAGATALVLGGTGPVGQRVARLLCRAGAKVRLGSRQADRAAPACAAIAAMTGTAPEPVATGSTQETAAALAGADLVVAAGAAGACLLPASVRKAAGSLRVAVDLNAVPPAGIEGVDAMDKGADRDGVKCYGAIGVGGTKMKIHRAAVAKLFERNDQVLEAEEIFEIGRTLA